MRGSKNFLSDGCPPILTFFLFVLFFCGDGERIEMPLKVGHHRHASETPLKWPTIECWFGSFVIFRGSGSILLGNPIFFVIFRGGGGGGGDPLSPPLDPPMSH